MSLNATSTTNCTGVLNEDDAETIDGGLLKDIVATKHARDRKLILVWRNIIAFSYVHLAAVYGLWLMITSSRYYTVAFVCILYVISGLGITAGAHRLWAHRSYKARTPLKILLVLFQTIAFQNHVIKWARDHRVHHKYSETDADPHNAKRGLFFSHVGWVLCKKHPDVISKGKDIDVSDLLSCSILQFQKKYYLFIMPLLCFITPTLIPVYFWDETWVNAWFVATMFRWILTLNVTWLVNSFSHKWGNRPYDKYINSGENTAITVVTLGEGLHNYHHTFPWDYKTAELGIYTTFNFTTAFINFFAKIGWAYDLKSVSNEIIEKRVKRTGDGTHHIWGWGDKDQKLFELHRATITYPKKKL